MGIPIRSKPSWLVTKSLLGSSRYVVSKVVARGSQTVRLEACSALHTLPRGGQKSPYLSGDLGLEDLTKFRLRNISSLHENSYILFIYILILIIILVV